MSRTLYYLPGRGGSLNTGLGVALQQRGWSLVGRETAGAFQRLSFGEQIEAIAGDLLKDFWIDQARLVANSYGAYLFWHAQAKLPSFPGRVLLLSPVIGSARTPDGRMEFRPPRAERLMELAESGELQAPHQCEMHVGELDWQCPLDRLRPFCSALGVPPSEVPGGGHLLDRDYVSSVLDRWLS